MNLDFSEEQKSLGEALRNVLTNIRASAARVKHWKGARHSTRRFGAKLGDLGWLAAAMPVDAGGQGLGEKCYA